MDFHESDGGLACTARISLQFCLSKDDATRHGTHASMLLDGSDRGLASSSSRNQHGKSFSAAACNACSAGEC